jgi:Leucine-rich repeat (LRR) protein
MLFSGTIGITHADGTGSEMIVRLRIRVFSITIGLLAVCGMLPTGCVQDTVSIPDRNLERIIRTTVGEFSRPLHEADLDGITRLDGSDSVITDLSGIEHCINLEWLDLSGNLIVDVSSLSHLPGLTYLDLRRNPVSDISPLAGIRSLTDLKLQAVTITDLSPVSQLVNLTALTLGSVTDLSALEPLTKLTNLSLSGYGLRTSQTCNLPTTFCT